MAVRLAVAIIVLLLSACGGSDPSAETVPASSLATKASSSSASISPCPNCLLGPVSLTRQTGEPETKRFLLDGDPAADYVIELDESDSQGADSVVTLDGTVILAAKEDDSTAPRHIVVNIRLSASSILTARLTGKPGSTLSITIRAGAKVIGTTGGSLVMPEGIARLEIPAGAVSQLTEFSISPAVSAPPGYLGTALILEPSGVSFSSPVNLSVSYDPSYTEDDWSPGRFTLAVESGGEWIDIPTQIDTVNHRLVAALNHFSIYAYKAADKVVTTPDGRTWTSTGGCWKSNDNAYNAKLGELAVQIFKLSAPPTTSKGCITTTYLEKGYSRWFAGLENHAGLDFSAKLANVHSLVDGTVDFERWTGQTGTPPRATLTLKTTIGGKTYRVLYLHCNEHKVTQGQTVKKGDLVCVSGDIGSKGQYHLHLEVKEDGMDDGVKTAISPARCAAKGLYFYGGWNTATGTYDSALKTSGCTGRYIDENTVDPTVILVASSKPGMTVGTDDGTGGNCQPFGCPSAMYQQIYSSSLFSEPVIITGLSFHRTDASGRVIVASSGSNVITPGTYDFSLSTTSKSVGGLDLVNLASNIGSDNKVVFSGVLGGTPDTLSISGTPFLYDPAKGRLLLTITRSSELGFGGIFFSSMNGSAGSLFSRAGDGIFGTTGYGLVTTFAIKPAAP